MAKQNEENKKISFGQRLNLTKNEIKKVYWGEDEEIRRDVIVIIVVTFLGSIMMLAAGSISKTVIEFIINLGKTQ